MKKFVSALFLSAAAIVLIACGVTTTASDSELLSDEQDVYAVQAISASELLMSYQDNIALTAEKLSLVEQAQVALLEETEESEEETVVTEEVDVVDKYLSMMEQFLGNDNGLSVTVVESDLPEYAVKVIYTTRSLLGDEVTYTLYYNETLYEEPADEETGDTTTTTTTTTEDTTTSEDTTETMPTGYQNQERDFEFEDEGDDEVLYSLEGILIVGDLTYNLEGKKVVEEDEEVLMLRAYVDHDNFVKVRYQTDLEDGDQKFFYEVKTAGVIVNKSKVKISTDEDGELMVKLEFVEGEASGKYQFKKYVEGNVTTIKVKYEVETADGVEDSGWIHITATYDEATGTTSYEYVLEPEEGHQGKSIEKHHEDHHGHGDDDEEDDDQEGTEGQNGFGGNTGDTNVPSLPDGSADSEAGVTSPVGDDVVNG